MALALLGGLLLMPLMAPPVGLFVLDCIAIALLGSALVRLMLRVHEQAKGADLNHKSLVGSLFAVGVLLLIVAGGGTWLLTGAVAGLLHG
jgi:formate/nitrite transporter FocA (FNT family)